MITNDCVNSEREKANLLCLIKLTLKTLIDQSSSPTAPTILDDRNADVTNFILTLERVLNFRMKPNWLSERRFFWDFVRPACIGSARHNFIERVEDVSRARSLKDKGRTWIKFALMEKKLSELLKLVLSDCNLVRKYFHDDSILTSNQAFILCDQLAGLSALDFSFCFKQDGPMPGAFVSNALETDVIDLTPYLAYKSKQMKCFQEQNGDEENKEPTVVLSSINELKILNTNEKEMIPLEKYKLEVEQRKYFEDLLRHREQELQQIKARFETLKTEKDNDVRLMENIIIELQLELRTAREDAEFKRKKSQQTPSITPPRSLFKLPNRKVNSPTTPTNDQNRTSLIIDDHNDDDDIDTQMRPIDATLITTDKFDIQLSRRSSHSTTTTNTDDDQYELARQMTTVNSQLIKDIKPISSPEMVSSATSLSTPSSSDDDDDDDHEPIDSSNEHSLPTRIYESGRFEPVEMTAEQANLLEEASSTTT